MNRVALFLADWNAGFVGIAQLKNTIPGLYTAKNVLILKPLSMKMRLLKRICWQILWKKYDFYGNVHIFKEMLFHR